MGQMGQDILHHLTGGSIMRRFAAVVVAVAALAVLPALAQDQHAHVVAMPDALK
jgi:hypothetical protein